MTGSGSSRREEQLGFDIEGLAPAAHSVSPHAIRLELNALLHQAKAAHNEAPWDRRAHQHYRNLFPQKAKWLPPEEAEFLSRQFELELERIERLLAA